MTFSPAIVIPIYNHGPALADMLPCITAQADLPIILVDDASSPLTKDIVDGLARELRTAILVRHSTNGGKGAAVMSGLRKASEMGFTHALQIDADGQHDPNDISNMLELAKQNPEALIAGQPIYDSSVPRLRYYARYLTHIWIWIETLSFDIKDSMCGFRVYPLAATVPLLETKMLGRRMDFDPEIMVRLHWQGVRVIAAPTKVKYDVNGLSNFLPIKDNALVSWMHVRLVIGAILRLSSLVARRFSKGNS